MRNILHLGLFALVLATFTTADAQGRRRTPSVRQTTVVVDTRPAPAPRRDWRRDHYRRSTTAAHADLQRQRRDHAEIVRISRRFRDASYYGDVDAKRDLKWRANAWIDREIAEAECRPNRGHYVVRLHALQRELNARHRGHRYGYHHGRGHGAARKARVLDELVSLSAEELRRAEIRARRSVHLAFSQR
jgi:hypothetical protein